VPSCFAKVPDSSTVDKELTLLLSRVCTLLAEHEPDHQAVVAICFVKVGTGVLVAEEAVMGINLLSIVQKTE